MASLITRANNEQHRDGLVAAESVRLENGLAYDYVEMGPLDQRYGSKFQSDSVVFRRLFSGDDCQGRTVAFGDISTAESCAYTIQIKTKGAVINTARYLPTLLTISDV